jgi:outer membrane protein OmpU
MNQLTKLGASALCGSLAAIASAHAGSMSVTGGVDMSWISLDDETTGNPIGMGSNLTFSGSGEMENGWNVSLSVAMDNKDAYSNTNVTVTVPTLGDIQVSQGVSGTGIDRMDDVTPNVWEEAYGTGLGTGIKTVAGTSGGTTIEYTPNMMPDGLVAKIAYSPSAGNSGANDKASSTSTSTKKSGYDLTLTATDAIHGIAGLTVNAGMSQVEQDNGSSTIAGDLEEQTVAVTYAAGGFTLGYQWSEQDLGTNTGAKQYDNTGYGITFNVNDDLSVGYNNFESEQVNSGGNVTAEASSIQVAYSVGGASIRLAEATVDNAKYNTGVAYDRDATTLSVSLAF